MKGLSKEEIANATPNNPAGKAIGEALKRAYENAFKDEPGLAKEIISGDFDESGNIYWASLEQAITPIQ